MKFYLHNIPATPNKARIAYLSKCGHPVLVVWEQEIKADIQAVEKRVLEFLEKNNGSGH